MRQRCVERSVEGEVSSERHRLSARLWAPRRLKVQSFKGTQRVKAITTSPSA